MFSSGILSIKSYDTKSRLRKGSSIKIGNINSIEKKFRTTFEFVVRIEFRDEKI
jgi:hypothetical protein